GLIALERFQLPAQPLEPLGRRDGTLVAVVGCEVRSQRGSDDRGLGQTLHHRELLEPLCVTGLEIQVETGALHSGIPSAGSNAAKRARRCRRGSGSEGGIHVPLGTSESSSSNDSASA